MTFDPSRGPGPGTVERAVAAWQRTKALLDQDAHLYADDAAQVLGEIAIEEHEALSPEVLLQRVLRAIIAATYIVDNAKAEIAVVRATEQRYARRVETLRFLLLDLMQAFDKSTLRTALGTISVRDGTPSLLVTDETAIPDAYWRETITRSLNRAEVADDLRNGVFVPGAVLSNGPDTIAIRRARATPD